MRHETFHALWRFAKASMDKADVEALYSHFPQIDKEKDLAKGGVGLDEAMAHEFEKYASGEYVSPTLAGKAEKAVGGIVRGLGGLLDALKIGRADSVGKDLTLKGFYDQVLAGKLGSGALGVEMRKVEPEADGAAKAPRMKAAPETGRKKEAELDEKPNADRKIVHSIRIDQGLSHDEAKSRLDELRGKEYKNVQTGISARLSANGAGKLISNAAVAKTQENGFTAHQHNELAANIDKLFADAVLVESRPDRDGDVNIKSIKRFAAPVSIGDAEAVAWITVKESVEHGHRIYSVEGIKISALSPSVRRALADHNSADSAENNGSLPQPGSAVKAEAATLEKPAASNVPGQRFYRLQAGEGVWIVGELVVSDVDSLRTSDKGNLSDATLQNRMGGKEREGRINQIAARPNPRLMGTVNEQASGGFVWTMPNGDVFIGNTRTTGATEAYARGTADELREYMIHEADVRGIEIPEGVTRPLVHFVLRRIESADGKATIQDVVRMTNESTVTEMTSLEKAKNDADVVEKESLAGAFAFRADGRIDETKSGDAIGRFRVETGAQGMVADDGTLTEEGQTRIQNAALAALLGGDAGNAALLQKVMQNAKRLDMQSELRALMKMTPELMALAKEKPAFDLRGPLGEALQLFAEWRDKDEEMRLEKGKSRHDWRETKDGKRVRGISWEAFMSQGDMFRKPSEEAKILGDLLAAAEAERSFDREDVESAAGKKRAIDLVSSYLADYAANARAVNTETEDMFGGSPASRADVMSAQRNKDSGVRFSVEVNPNLRAEIDAALAKRTEDNPEVKQMKRHDEIVFSENLPFFDFLGLPNLRVVTDVVKVRKFKAKHHLTEDQIVDLPNRYNAPAAVMKDGDDGLVVLTDMIAPDDHGNEKPVMVYLRKKTKENGESLFIATAFSHNAEKERSYYEPLMKGGLLFADENKIAGLSLGEETESILRTQASGDNVKTSEDFSSWSSTYSIAQSSAAAQGGELTRTPAFKKWFGDSKVVDENAAQERARSEGAFKPETRFSIRSEADGKKDEEKKKRPRPDQTATASDRTPPAPLNGDSTSHTLTLESADPVRKFGDSISQDGVKSPADFLTGLVHALGSEETNPDKTQYFDITHEDGKNLSLRVANHRATARFYRERGNNADVKTSIVVKMSDRLFRPDRDVELTEHVYFSDKLTAEREAAIARAVAEWIATGEWNGPAADQVNMSPRRRYSIGGVYTGTAADYANRSREGGADGGARFSVVDKVRALSQDMDRLRSLSVRDAALIRQAIALTDEIPFADGNAEADEIVAAYKSKSNEDFKKVQAWCHAKVNAVNTNKYIGDIGTSNRSVRDVLMHTGKGRGPLKVLVFQRLDDILQNAVPYNYGEDNRKRFYALAHRMSYNGEPYYARVIVEETENGNRTYTVEFSEGRKIVGGGTNTQGEASTSTPQPPTSKIILHNLLRSQAGGTDVRFSVSPAEDAAYMDAVRRGDMETAQRMVREAAANKGYKLSSGFFVKAEYAVDSTPDKWDVWAYEVGKQLRERYGELSENAMWNFVDFNEEFLANKVRGPLDNLFRGEPYETASNQAYFSAGFSGEDMPRFVFARRIGRVPESGQSYNFRDQKPEGGVSVLGVYEPKGFREQNDGTYRLFNGGKEYLIAGYEIGRRGSDGEPLLVRAQTLGDAEGAIKSADPVTYDDAGNVIPLSQRFNPKSNDIRYSVVSFRDDNIRVDHKWRDGEMRYSISAGADLENFGNYEAFKAFMSIEHPIPGGAQLLPEDVTPTAALAYFEANILGRTITMPDGEPLTLDIGHFFRLVCDGDHGKKGFVSGYKSSAEAIAAIRRGEVSGEQINGFQSDRARMLPVFIDTVENPVFEMQEKKSPDKTQFVKRYEADGGRGVVAAFRFIRDGRKIQSFHGFSTRYGKAKKYRITYVGDAVIRGASPDAPVQAQGPQASHIIPNLAPPAQLASAVAQDAAKREKTENKGGFRASVEAPRRVATPYPNLATMSDEELVAAALAARIVTGDRKSIDKGPTTAHTYGGLSLSTVESYLRRVKPGASDSEIALLLDTTARRARDMARAMREDLDRGVSESAVVRNLDGIMRDAFGAEMGAQANRGRRFGRFGAKAEDALANRQAKIVADAVRNQTGIELEVMEDATGVNLAESVADILENELNRPPRGGGEQTVIDNLSNPAAGDEGEGGEGAAPAEQEVSAKAKAAVDEILALTGKKAEEDAAKRKKRKEAAERQKAEDAAMLGEESGGEGAGGGYADGGEVAAAIRKAKVELKNPRHLALFVVEFARRYWNRQHGKGVDFDPWGSAVAVQFLRKTAQDVYGKLVRTITYSRSRETSMRRVESFANIPTVGRLVNEMEYVGALVNARRIREDAQAMCEKLREVLEKQFGATGRFKPDDEELRRRVPAELELRARYMKHIMWLTPEGCSKEAEELAKELAAARSEFDDAGADVEQSRVYADVMRKIAMLREFGGLRYKRLAEIEAAVQWWTDAAEGGAREICDQWTDREERTSRLAGVLAAAFRNPKLKRAVERSLAQTFGDYFHAHAGFTHLLRDLMRFAGDKERAEAERVVEWLELEVQKAGTRAMSEKRRMGEAFKAAVERIYGRKFGEVVKELTAEDARFAPFMGETDAGLRVMPTRARALQLYASLVQVGRQVEVDDPENPNMTMLVWQGGYHDNIVANGREGQAEELAKLLTVEDMNLIAWMRKWYEQNRKGLSDVSEALFGVGVHAETGNYMPVKMLLDPQGLEKPGGAAFALFPKALTPRVRNERDFDTTADILTMWGSRMEEAAQWKAHAELGLELRGIFGRAELQKAIVASHGRKAKNDVLAFVTDILAGHGNADSSADGAKSFIDSVRGWAALGALAGNVGVMMKQTTSIPAFGFEIGMVKTAKYVATALTPEGIAAMRTLWNSEERRNRWTGGNTEAVANALSDDNPSAIKQLLIKWMATNRLGDAVPGLVVGQGIYRDALGRGMTAEDAMAYTWMLVERTQQSSRVENRSAFQRRGKLGNIIYQFLTTQQQYLQYELRTLREAVSDPKSARKWGGFLRAVTLNHFILSSAYYWMGELYKALLGQEPPEDRLADWVVGMLTGPYGALYGIGLTTADALREWIKPGSTYGRSGSSIPSLQWLETVVAKDPTRVVWDTFDGSKSWDDVLDDLNKWLSDFNATYRDLSKLYRYRVKEEPQKRR